MADPRAVFLVGYRGTGKSTVGPLLAARLGGVFLDTDRMVEDAFGKSIAACFHELGEGAFRDYESSCLDTIAGRARDGERLIVATGGGIVLRQANVARMRELGAIVWLTATADVIRSRLSSDPATAAARPALAGASAVDEVEAVLRARQPMYRHAADACFATDDAPPADVVEAIATWFEQQPPEGDE